jgi:hypothetical protein
MQAPERENSSFSIPPTDGAIFEHNSIGSKACDAISFRSAEAGARQGFCKLLQGFRQGFPSQLPNFSKLFAKEIKGFLWRF